MGRIYLADDTNRILEAIIQNQYQLEQKMESLVQVNHQLQETNQYLQSLVINSYSMISEMHQMVKASQQRQDQQRQVEELPHSQVESGNLGIPKIAFTESFDSHGLSTIQPCVEQSVEEALKSSTNQDCRESTPVISNSANSTIFNPTIDYLIANYLYNGQVYSFNADTVHMSIMKKVHSSNSLPIHQYVFRLGNNSFNYLLLILI